MRSIGSSSPHLTPFLRRYYSSDVVTTAQYIRSVCGGVGVSFTPALILLCARHRYFEEFIVAPMIMCVVWLGVCIVVLCPSKRSSGSKGVPLLVQERCKKAARLGALGRALSKLGLGLALVAVLGEVKGEGRGLTGVSTSVDTSGVRAAVDDAAAGDVVLWVAGTGVLAQTWKSSGWG